MKKAMMAALGAAALCLAGCVGTVTQDKPGNLPTYRDRMEYRLEHPAAKVFEAAKRAFNTYGTITREDTSQSAANATFYIEGTVNRDRVWIRIDGVSASATKMVIQVRAPVGGTNLRLADELQQRTAFELTR